MGTQLSKRPETPMPELLEDILMLMPMVSFKRLNTLLMVQDSVLLTLVSLSSTLTSLLPQFTPVLPPPSTQIPLLPQFTPVLPLHQLLIPLRLLRPRLPMLLLL